MCRNMLKLIHDTFTTMLVLTYVINTMQSNSLTCVIACSWKGNMCHNMLGK